MSTIYEVLNNNIIEPCINELGTLVASDAQDYDYYGKSVSVHGDLLAVGAYAEDTAGSDVGKVYVYRWNRLTKAYNEIQQILPPDGAPSDYFGYGVAIDNNRLIVSSVLHDAAITDGGKVYIYDWSEGSNSYVLVSSIVAPDAQSNDLFGYSVALDGKRLVVGAGAEDTGSPNGGKVYIYDWVDNITGYTQVQQLVASDSAGDDYFGSAVSVYGNKLVVGAFFKDVPTVDAGKVYVYEWNFDTNSYVEISQLVASDAEVSDYFGSSVSLNGNRLVVGAVGADWGGRIYVYEWDSGLNQFIEKIKIIASDAESGDYYSGGVALFNNRLVVSAQNEDTAGVDAGKVYIYDICSILKKINTTEDQTNETNINWIENGERAGDLTLNRPIKQVSDVINNLIEHFAALDQLSYSDIQTQITVEINDAVSAESTARETADISLQNQISAEVTSRTDADISLQNQIDDKAASDGTNATGTWGISISGSSVTANSWTTPRTLTIGATGKSVDGSSDVSWSLPEIGINISTEAQARVGTDSSTLMTPERTSQHYDERTIVSTGTPTGSAPNKSLWLQVS